MTHSDPQPLRDATRDPAFLEPIPPVAGRAPGTHFPTSDGTRTWLGGLEGPVRLLSATEGEALSRSEGDPHTAVRCLADCVEKLLQEIPRGASARLEGAQQDLRTARTALDAFARAGAPPRTPALAPARPLGGERPASEPAPRSLDLI